MSTNKTDAAVAAQGEGEDALAAEAAAKSKAP